MALITNIKAYFGFNRTFLDSVAGTLGTASGAVSYGTGKSNYCINVNGGTDRVNFAAPISLQTTPTVSAFSIAAWVKFTNAAAAYEGVVQRSTAAIGLYRTPAGKMSYYDVAAGSDHAGATTVVVGAWTHVVFTYAGASGDWKIYLNGVLDGSGSGAALDASVLNSAGAASGGTPRPMTGQIDELGMWENRELTAGDVTDLFRAGAGAYYPFLPVVANTTLLSNLQRYYRLDSNGTEEVSAQNGVPTGAVTYVAGARGTAADFNHDIARRIVAPGLDLMTDLSISVWLYPTGGTSSFAGIVNQQIGAGGTDTNYSLIVNGLTCGFYVTNNANPVNATLTVNTWNHIVVTRTITGTCRMYLNSIAQTVSLNNLSHAPYSTPAASLWIGNRPDLFDAFQGYIDELAIYSTAIPEGFIQALYGSGTPPNYTDFATTPIPELQVNFPFSFVQQAQLISEGRVRLPIDLSCHDRGQQRKTDESFVDLYLQPSSGGSFTVEVYEDRLELVYSANVQLTGAALLPEYWPITTNDATAPIPVVTSIEVAGARIKLYNGEAREGVTYTLTLPPVGIQDIAGLPYGGPFTFDYVAEATEPFLSLAGAQDGFHVKVIFSEPVNTEDALTAANYVITGGAGLTVYDVVQETVQVYVLRTSLQVVGQSYTVTASNIRDLAGNLI